MLGDQRLRPRAELTPESSNDSDDCDNETAYQTDAWLSKSCIIFEWVVSTKSPFKNFLSLIRVFVVQFKENVKREVVWLKN